MCITPELRDEVTSPALSFFSKTMVSFPEDDSSRAMLNPITPPPIMITSVIYFIVIRIDEIFHFISKKKN